MNNFFDSLKETSALSSWVVWPHNGYIRFVDSTFKSRSLCPVEKVALHKYGYENRYSCSLFEVGKFIGLSAWETILILRAADNMRKRPEFDLELRRRMLEILNLKEPESVS
jgi:hypothetical protein